MKYDKLFALAKEKGIEDIEISIETSSDLSFSLFHSEIDEYSSANSSSYLIRGIYKGKLGAITTDFYDNSRIEYYIDEIINNAKYIENDDPVFIFKGSEKYHKINTFNKDLPNISIDDKINKLHELEEKIKNGDEHIVEVEGVQYGESSSSETIINSHGLKLSQSRRRATSAPLREWRPMARAEQNTSRIHWLCPRALR